MDSIAELDRDIREAIWGGNLDDIMRLADIADTQDRHRKTVRLPSAALWYATQGLYVFPLQPRSKLPLKGSHGCKDATRDPDVILRWWAATDDANLAIATGRRIDVVDIDGATGRESESQNLEIFGTLTVLGKVNTPRPGGAHYYIPATGRGNKAGYLPGIDFRGIGGYVVAPPSVTDIGTYTWVKPLELPHE